MNEPPDEKQMIARILKGDARAQTWLVEVHRQRLYAASVHLLGYRDPEAEDVVQQTFVIAFEKLSGFEGRSSLYTWMAHICVNLCYERLRARDRQVVSAQQDLDFVTSPAAFKRHEVMEAEDEKGKRLALVSEAMKRMDGKCREILTLRDVDGVPYAGIGDRLKVPIGTVMSRLARCRKVLKEWVMRSMKEVPQ